MKNSLIVKTQVRNILDANDVKNMSSDFMATLDNEVETLIVFACLRAKKNGRKTVMGKDV